MDEDHGCLIIEKSTSDISEATKVAQQLGGHNPQGFRIVFVPLTATAEG
jgi:hypothetical protein